jgi:hypothetical protein
LEAGDTVEDKRFDDLSRAVAAMSSRRLVLRGIIGGAIASLAGSFGIRGAAAATKRGPGEICRKPGDCDPALDCIPDSTGRSRCGCGAGTTLCNGVCCNTFCYGGVQCMDSSVDPACFDACVSYYTYHLNNTFNYNFNQTASFKTQAEIEQYCAFRACAAR